MEQLPVIVDGRRTGALDLTHIEVRAPVR